MGDENTPENKGGNGDEFEPITSQDELNKVIAKRIERVRAKFADYDDLKAKAAEFDRLSEANKTEIQKAIERADAAERRAAEFEAKEQRATWAADITKGSTVPPNALRGNTREELEEHFKVLAALIPTTPPTRRTATPPGRPAPDGGGSRAAAALRELRRNAG